MSSEVMANGLREMKVTQLPTGQILTRSPLPTPCLGCFHCFRVRPGAPEPQHVHIMWVIVPVQLPSYCVILGMSLLLLDPCLTSRPDWPPPFLQASHQVSDQALSSLSKKQILAQTPFVTCFTYLHSTDSCQLLPHLHLSSSPHGNSTWSYFVHDAVPRV